MVLVLAIEERKLHKMVPKMLSPESMTIMSHAHAQTNSCALSLHFYTGSQCDQFRIDLPCEGRQLHPSSNEFVNTVLCPFLHTQMGKLRELFVFDSSHMSPLLSRVLAAMGGKGITYLSIRDYTGGISFERGQEELFRPLVALDVYAAELIGRDFHAELGRLISVSSGLQSLDVSIHRRLTNAGFANLFRGLHSLQKLENIHIFDAQLGQYQMGTIERFFDILKSLSSLKILGFMHGSISVEGTTASYFWTQLLRLPNLSLTLKACSIPDSAAPLLHNILAESGCQVAHLDLRYEDDDTRDSVIALEGIYSGVALNQSIKTLHTRMYLTDSQHSRQIRPAVCNMIAVNTTLTKIELEGYELWQHGRPEYYAMYFHALRQNQKLADVQVEVTDGPIGKESATAIASYLESSSALQKFSLSGGYSIDVAFATQLYKGVRKSKSLQELEIQQWFIEGYEDYKNVELFVEELAHNYNIVNASFGDFQSDKLDCYLAFNRYGRKHLLDKAFPTELLPLVFARQGDDHVVDCIYRCLRENPHFVSN